MESHPIKDRGQALRERWQHSPLSSRLRVALVATLLLATLLAWTGWSPVPGTRRPLQVAALDVSESVAASALEQAVGRLAQLERHADLLPMAFAAGPWEVARAADLARVPTADGPAPGALDRSRSDLGAALLDAVSRLRRADPEHRRVWRVVLASDGLATAGKLDEVLPLLLRQRVAVDVVPLSTAGAALRIDGVRALQPPRAEAPLDLEVEVAAATSEELRLEVRAGEQLLGTQKLSVQPPAAAAVVTVRLPRPGYQRLDVEAVRPDAADRAVLASRTIWLEAGDTPRLLLVEGDQNLSPLASRLNALGWRVERVRPAAVPTSADRLQRYAVVALDDVEAKALGDDRMRALRDWVVEDGGGLLFASGPETYGEEGYSETALESILPMRFNVEEERTDVALMIALDKSYSMRGDKIELAKEAAKAVIGELDDKHRFGLVAFDWNPFRVVPLQPVRHREAIVEAIRRIEASAQTNFYPALEACFQQLQEVEAKVKHVILISDGRTYPDEYQRLVTAMHAAEITVSTVGVGSEADRELLADIARWGGGQTYYVEDASRVQQILLDETRAKTEDTVVEKATPVVPAAPVAALAGIDLGALPALGGFVTLEARDQAVIALQNDEGKPLLGRRNVGLGRTWMFAADLGDRWAADWLSWPQGVRVFSQLLRDAAGRASLPRMQLGLAQDGEDARLELDAVTVDGQPDNSLQPRATVRGGGADLASLPLAQVAPGRYRVDLSLADAAFDGAREPLDVELSVDGRPVAMRAILPPALSEKAPGPPDRERLWQLAQATGGRFDPDDRALAAADPRRPRHRALWPLLAALALVLYLVELALRRTGWPHARRLAAAAAAGSSRRAA